jgi:tRNA (guanine-N7-)-methyltransferase
MGQKKLIRFEELKTFSNVLQFPENMPGKWNEFFGNENPITLELACGKGEYTVGLAEMHLHRNFLGIDIKGNRLWVGARRANQKELKNVGFLRAQIDGITSYFAPGEVSEIWITFPDPQLRMSKAKKRLTHPKFLREYHKILRAGGIIHLKTDSPDLYNFTKMVLELSNCSIHLDYDDVYSGHPISDELNIQTHYEGLDIAQSNRIHYLSFSLPVIFAGKELDDKVKQILKDAAVD